jgi:hypothetical protein
MGEDARGRLSAQPFSFLITKDGAVRVDWGGRTVRVIAGEAGRRLARELESADAHGRQQLLARATGNFRHSNERARRSGQ